MSVKQIDRMIEAPPLLRAFLPFRYRTGHFRAVSIQSLASVGMDSMGGLQFSRLDTETGELKAGLLTCGMLPAPDCARLLSDLDTVAVLRGNAYVIYSYETPIAWPVIESDSGAVRIYAPDHEYSPTTARHQEIVSRAYSGAV